MILENVRFADVFRPFIKLPALNLGCGITPITGWTNADLYNDPDLRMDMRKPWPLEDNQFNTLYAGHVLEHFTGEEIFHIFMEAGRVLKPGGHFLAVTPYGRSDMQMSALHHITPWLPGTINCITRQLWRSNPSFEGMKQGSKQWNWEKKIETVTVTKAFQWMPNWLLDSCARHLNNVYTELVFVLRLNAKV